MTLVGKMNSDSKYTRQEAISFVNHMENVEISNLDAELKTLSIDIEDMINDDMRMTNESNLKDLLDFGSPNHNFLMDGLKKKSPEMYEQMNYIFSTEQGKLDDGVRGVMLVQASLNALGYTGKEGMDLELDGSFGPQTFYALVKFQVQSQEYKSQGGKPDSICGRLTVQALINDLDKGKESTSIKEREVEINKQKEKSQQIDNSKEELGDLMVQLQDRFDEWFLLLTPQFPGLIHEEGNFEYKGKTLIDEELIVNGKPKLRILMDWLNNIKHIETVQSKIGKLPKGENLESWPIDKIHELVQLKKEAQDAVDNAVDGGIKLEDLNIQAIESLNQRIEIMKAISKAIQDVKKLPIGTDLKKWKLSDYEVLNNMNAKALISIENAIQKGAELSYIEKIIIDKPNNGPTRIEKLTVKDVLLSVKRRMDLLEAKLIVKESIDNVQGLINTLPSGTKLQNRKVEDIMELKAKRGEVEVELQNVLEKDLIEIDDFNLDSLNGVNSRIVELESESKIQNITNKTKEKINDLFKDVDLDSYDETNLSQLIVISKAASDCYDNAINNGVVKNDLADQDKMIQNSVKKILEIKTNQRIAENKAELEQIVNNFDSLDKNDLNGLIKARDEALYVYNNLKDSGVDLNDISSQNQKIEELNKKINELEALQNNDILIKLLDEAISNLPISTLNDQTIDDLPQLVKLRDDASEAYDNAKTKIGESLIQEHGEKIKQVSTKIDEIIQEAKTKCEDIGIKITDKTGEETRVEIKDGNVLLIVIGTGGEIKINYKDIKDQNDVNIIINIITEKKVDTEKTVKDIELRITEAEKLIKDNDPDPIKTRNQIEFYTFDQVDNLTNIIIEIRKQCEEGKDSINDEDMEKLTKKIDVLEKKLERINKLLEIQSLLLLLKDIPKEDKFDGINDKEELIELYNTNIAIIDKIQTINTVNKLNLTINLTVFNTRLEAIKKREEELNKKDAELEKLRKQAEQFAKKYPDVNYEDDKLFYRGMTFGSDPFELISNFNDEYMFQDWYDHWRTYGIRKDESKEIYDNEKLNSLYVNKLKDQTFTHKELGLDKTDDFVSLYLDNYSDSGIIPKFVYNRFVDTNNIIDLDDVSLGKFTSDIGDKGQRLQDENDIFLSFDIDDSYINETFNEDRYIMLMNILSNKTEIGGQNLEIDKKKLVTEMRRVVQLAIVEMKNKVEKELVYEDASEKKTAVKDRIDNHKSRQRLYNFDEEELRSRGLNQANVDEWFMEFEDSNLDMCSSEIVQEGGKTVVKFQFDDSNGNENYNLGHFIEIDKVCDNKNQSINFDKMKGEIKRCILISVEAKFQSEIALKTLENYSFKAEEMKPDNIDIRTWEVWKSYFDDNKNIKLQNIKLENNTIHFEFDDNQIFGTRTMHDNYKIPINQIFNHGNFDKTKFNNRIKDYVKIATQEVKNEVIEKDKLNAKKFLSQKFNADDIKPDNMSLSLRARFSVWNDKQMFKDPDNIGLIQSYFSSGLELVNGKIILKFSFDDNARDYLRGNAENFNENHTIDLYAFMDFETGNIDEAKMNEEMKKCVRKALISIK